MVDDDVEVGPQLELPLPVGDGGEGCDHEEGSADPVLVNGIDPGQRLDQVH